MVTVFWPEGGNRVVFFEKGKVIGADLSQADGDAEVKATKNAGLNLISVGELRFEIPDTVVSGG